ncbi:hypothetical protein [Microcoleus sp.]
MPVEYLRIVTQNLPNLTNNQYCDMQKAIAWPGNNKQNALVTEVK